MKFLFGFLAVSGFVLLFGGVSIIDASQDVFTLCIGFAVSMIGLLSMGMSALSPAYLSNRSGNSETVTITGGN